MVSRGVKIVCFVYHWYKINVFKNMYNKKERKRPSLPETRKDIDVYELFLLSSTGQIKNCTGHLSVKYATLASLLQAN